ncbi:ankyrin repeat domain-containing protein [Beggiatoa alba]|uniref:ankyrin repeat domain-containing protein n=1 Tax=Beggiatoa alba TaxID=1022 RepID=UPI000312BCAE|nr:ankyrin repeat domain-containing protein [Beggiatoa alba]
MPQADWETISIFNDTTEMQKLLAKGFDINTQDTYGNTPLHYACGLGLKDSERQLRQLGTSLKHTVVENTDFINLLLKNGANPNIRNKQQETPLIPAIYQGRIATVELLLNSGANVNFQTVNGYTPLMLATYHCYQDIVQLLLDFNADTSIKDTSATPFSTAKDIAQRQCKEVYSKLINK